MTLKNWHWRISGKVARQSKALFKESFLRQVREKRTF
jgi:hypothetical protein